MSCCRASLPEPSSRAFWTTWRPPSRSRTKTFGWRSRSSSRTRTTASSRGPTYGCGCRSVLRPRAGATSLGWHPIDEAKPGAPGSFTPYGHQAEAFARLSSADLGPDKPRPLPTLVTTGTGSGKTEAFLYPILDHVLRAKAQGVTGMKALLLYPMNALANDQAQRLADLITDAAVPRRGDSRPLHRSGRAEAHPRDAGRAHHRSLPDAPQRPGHPAHQLQDARPDAAPARGRKDLGAERHLTAVPRPRRVPHLRRRPGDRRRHAAATSRADAQGPRG